MTVSGGASRPSISVASGAAIAAGATKEHVIDVGDARFALVTVSCTKAYDVYFLASAQVDAAAPLADYYVDGNAQQKTGLAAAKTITWRLPVESVQTFSVFVNNTDAGAGTYSIDVSLSY